MFGGIGKAIGSVFGSGAGKGGKEGWLGMQQPTLAEANLDPEAKKLLDRQNQELSRSYQDIASDELQGVQDIYGQEQAALAGRGSLSASKFGEAQDPALYEALNRRSRKTMDKDLNQLQRQTQLGARAKEQQRLQTRTTMMSNEAQHKLNISRGRLQADVNRANARANAINSFIGTGAQIVGGIIGGPGGAKAVGSAQQTGQQQQPMQTTPMGNSSQNNLNTSQRYA